MNDIIKNRIKSVCCNMVNFITKFSWATLFRRRIYNNGMCGISIEFFLLIRSCISFIQGGWIKYCNYHLLSPLYLDSFQNFKFLEGVVGRYKLLQLTFHSSKISKLVRFKSLCMLSGFCCRRSYMEGALFNKSIVGSVFSP